MNETQQTPTETPQANASAPNEFPGLEETRREVAQIAGAPPSPMPLPINGAATPSTEAAKVEGRSTDAAKPAYKGKDYKGRTFDPRLHRVKADASPEYNADGSLKILPKSKQGLADKVKGFFKVPPSDHERQAEEDAAGQVQARSIAQREEMEASAFFLKEGYFMLGETIAGPGFLTDMEKREARIISHFMAYEQATGRSFDPPPWLALAVGLGMDFKKTVSNVPECRERIDDLKSSIFERAVSGAVGRSFLGKLMFWKRKPKKRVAENVASREFTRSRMESEEGLGE